MLLALLKVLQWFTAMWDFCQAIRSFAAFLRDSDLLLLYELCRSCSLGGISEAVPPSAKVLICCLGSIEGNALV